MTEVLDSGDLNSFLREKGYLNSNRLNLVLDTASTLFDDIKKQLDDKVNRTAYGEPQAFVDLDNGRSIEVTLEQEMLPEDQYFYSIRLHCSEVEFDNNEYQSTNGIFEQFCTESACVDEIQKGLITTLFCNEMSPVRALEECLVGEERRHGLKSDALSDLIESASSRAVNKYYLGNSKSKYINFYR